MGNVLEALEKIQQAEKANEQTMQKLHQELREYKQIKEAELNQFRIDQRKLLEQLLEEKKQAEQHQATAEKNKLNEDAKRLQSTVQEQYEKQRKQAVDAIIERVKETYGRH
ncbi:hypothetical protein [Enterococcus sp. AZ084]|uniref:hypothetical protein n=1 Tax=Enterococcus sp. AZ084 TaxID=2774671 RepID=UPI003F69494E